MKTEFSPIVPVIKAGNGRGFSASRIDRDGLAGFTSPVMGLDHFRMSAPTFAPHPHAGFAAVSYLFEDSECGMRNRDSLGHDSVVAPGEIIWTQAGQGVIHDEVPERTGHTVHGIQLFVNSLGRNKQKPPQLLRLKREEVPVFSDAQGNRVRVVVGEYAELRSPLAPAEPFTLLDASLRGSMRFALLPGWNAVFYVMAGSLTLRSETEQRLVGSEQIVAVRSQSGADLELAATEGTRLLVLSGPAFNEPVVAHGPFIMNTEREIVEATERYRTGRMGSLAAL